MEEDKKLSPFEQDLELVKFYQEEFLYRHKHYWEILTKFFLLTVVVTILPIASEVMGVKLDELPQEYLLFFPALGFAIAVLGYHLLKMESERLSRVNGTKYRIMKGLGEKYCYDPIQNSSTKDGIACYMMRVTLGVELFIIVSVLMILLTNHGAPVVPGS